LGFALVLALGAGRTPAAPVPKHLMPKDQPLVYPTAAGTKWVYATGGDGEVTIVASKVEDDADGAKRITLDRLNADNTRAHHMTMLVSTKGVFLAVELNDPYDAPWCMLQLPHVVGQTWPTKPARKGNVLVDSTMRAAAVEKIKVPAGEIEAYRVDWKLGGQNVSYWYAPGYGLVKQSGGTNWQLKSITAGK
jgi:hypothetical protein